MTALNVRPMGRWTDRLTDSLTHSVTHSLTHWLTHSLTYKPLLHLMKHFFTPLSSHLFSSPLWTSDIYLASSTGVILHSVDSGTYANVNANAYLSVILLQCLSFNLLSSFIFSILSSLCFLWVTSSPTHPTMPHQDHVMPCCVCYLYHNVTYDTICYILKGTHGRLMRLLRMQSSLISLCTALR